MENIHETIWKGYKRYDLYVDGREAIMIVPSEVQEGMPWIWRAEFFDAFAYADMAMLEKGWHLLYYKISDMYGCPEAIDLMNQFQKYVTHNFGLAEKAVIFGFSRGGLYSFNYAAAHPEKVSGLYLDAPVLDIRSWPGGMGSGCGGAQEWQECLKMYRITEDEAKCFNMNPLDKIPLVAQAGIPIILVAGDADAVVPYEENGALLAKRYKELGGKIEVIVKPGVDHHPHSLENPEKIVDFILKNCRY